MLEIVHESIQENAGKHLQKNLQEIVIDEEFRGLLPPLDGETYAQLEQNIIRNGCRDSLVLWGNILIDGHNRYEICLKHDIPFNTIVKDFAHREEALIWIISTQVSRRNLTPLQLSHFRGLHYHADKRIIGGNLHGINQYNEDVRHSDAQPKSLPTKVRLAEQYHVSPKTIERDAKVASAIETIGQTSPAARRMILTGETSIDKKNLGRLTGIPKIDLNEVASAIENGTFDKRQVATYAPPDPAHQTDSVYHGIRRLKSEIGALSGAISVLPTVSMKANKNELKTAIRSCIGLLEDLHKQIK